MLYDVVALNQTDVSHRIRMFNNADGTPATGIDDAEAGLVISYQRGVDAAFVNDSGSAADLASIGAAHSDWGLFEIGNGWYRIDLPDAAFAEGVPSVLISMVTTAATAVDRVIVINPLFKFQGQASSVTSTTTTFPAGTTPLKGDIIMVVDGTGEPGNQVLVTSATGEVATHAAFETGISATTSTILLIAGDSVSADGGINCDAAISGLPDTSDISDLQTTADGIQTDTQDLQTRLPAALSSTGSIKSDVKEINAATVLGDGTSGDKWRGS